MTRSTARGILLISVALSFLLALAIGLRADTPSWSPVTWGVLFLASTVFLGGPIAFVLEWRATDRWQKPNPHVAVRDQVAEPAPGHMPGRRPSQAV